MKTLKNTTNTKYVNLRYNNNNISNARIIRYLDRKREEGYSYHATIKTALNLLIEREEGIRAKHLDIDPILMIKQEK